MHDPYLNLWHLTQCARTTIRDAVSPPEPIKDSESYHARWLMRVGRLIAKRKDETAVNPSYAYWDACLRRLAEHLAARA